MKNKIFIVSILFSLFISLFFSIKTINNLLKDTKNNTVNINDIVETTANNFPSSFDESISLSKKYNLDITIIDLDGNVLATSNKNMSQSVNYAIKNHDTILDIKKNKQLLGKLIIKNNASDVLNNNKKYLFFILGFTYSFLLINLFIFYLWIKNKIISPFNKLKDFASRVANGNLDIPLKMDKNNLFGAFTESFDIMRDELRIARQNEQKANQSKKELVASLSHDIKTPVASIKAISQLLQVYNNDAITLNKLKTIDSKADQIELLINNLFHATLEELEELKVNPIEESSEIITDLIKTSDFNNQVNEFYIPSVIIKCDKLRLGQVIDNIISNSYKYANTKININSYIENNYLNISFSDHGKGVLNEDLPLLCQKFYRGQNSQTQNGSGLGLYISKYFMNKMDGNLSVNNVSTNKDITGFCVTISLFIF